MSKRSSPNAAGAPAVKRGCPGVETEIERKCNSIIAVLKSHEEIPAALRTILCSAVEHSLVVPKDERHEFQNLYVQHIGQILESVKLPLEEELSEYEKLVEDPDARKADLEAKAKEAENTLNGLRYEAGRSGVSEQALSDAKAVEELVKTIAALDAKQEDMVADIEQVKAKIAELKDYLSQQVYPMKVLRVGHGIADRLIQDLKVFGFMDSGMLSTIRSVVMREPECRSTFDLQVIGLIITEFHRKICKTQEELTQLQQKKSEHEPELEARKAELATAEAKAASSDAALTKVFDAITESEADVVAKKKELAKWFPDLRRACNKFDTAKAKLEKFMSGPMQDYCDLKELAPVPQEPDEQEEFIQEQESEPGSEPGTPTVDLS